MSCLLHSVSAKPRRRAANSMLGSVGAAAGLLLPKCPLCWMALAGSFAGASRMQGSVEIVGVVLFVLAVGLLLRKRLPLRYLLPVLSIAGVVMALSTRLVLAWELRLAAWALFACAIVALNLFRTTLPAASRSRCPGQMEAFCGSTPHDRPATHWLKS
jgi:hypothetical protein